MFYLRNSVHMLLMTRILAYSIQTASNNRCFVMIGDLIYQVTLNYEQWSRLSRSSCSKRLLEILNDIVDMLRADRNPNPIFRSTRRNTLFFRELFVSRRPGMDSQGFRVTDAAQLATRTETETETEREREKGERTWPEQKPT